MSRIKDLARHQMPREKLIERGAENLKDFELLAILLRTGRKGKTVLEVSREILKKYPIKKLLKLNYQEISKIKGIGSAKACEILASFELTKRALEVEDGILPKINSAKEAVAQLQELRKMKKEHFVALYLNARNELVCKETVSIGILNASLIHPREVFKPAIDKLAVSVIIAHNHPSGDVKPSEDDIEITKRLKKAGEILGVEVLDHIIITENSCFSFESEKLI
jgi:DNA repair protein RadC